MQTLALDLEGTLISNVVSCWARPGLNDFLRWAVATFDRVVVFSAASPARVQCALDALVEMRDIEQRFAKLPIVNWSRIGHKKLEYVDAANPDQVWLVDDYEEYVDPSERHRWVAVNTWEAPYAPTDNELYRVQQAIEARL